MAKALPELNKIKLLDYMQRRINKINICLGLTYTHYYI